MALFTRRASSTPAVLDEADTNHDLLIDTESDGHAPADYPSEDVPSFAELGISDDLIAVLERDGITSPF
ncbi:MAG: hypothetical protein WD800_05940, partial [Dehalococcoidia bacterium]